MSTLPNLATLADLEARLGRSLTPDEQRTASRLLADASAKIRAYTGQKFSEVIDDVVALKVRSGKVRLPQRPISAVASVTVLAFDGSQQPVWFRWDGSSDRVAVTPQVLDAWAWNAFRCAQDTVTVQYSHGYPDGELPDVLLGLTVQVVGRALGTDLTQSGIQQEAIASYSYTLGAAAAAGGFGLLPSEKEILDDFRRPAGVVVVGP